MTRRNQVKYDKNLNQYNLSKNIQKHSDNKSVNYCYKIKR